MTHSPTCTGCPNCPGDVGELARAILKDPTNVTLQDLMANPERRPHWRHFAALASVPNPYDPATRAAVAAARDRDTLGCYADGIARVRGES